MGGRTAAPFLKTTKAVSNFNDLQILCLFHLGLHPIEIIETGLFYIDSVRSRGQWHTGGGLERTAARICRRPTWGVTNNSNKSDNLVAPKVCQTNIIAVITVIIHHHHHNTYNSTSNSNSSSSCCCSSRSSSSSTTTTTTTTTTATSTTATTTTTNNNNGYYYNHTTTPRLGVYNRGDGAHCSSEMSYNPKP